MKKLLITASVLAFAVAASAQDSVTSVNAAGFVKRTLEPGSFTLVSIPFESFDGSDRTITDVVGEGVPYNTRAFLWDKVDQEYVIEVFTQGSVFNGFVDQWDPGTNLLARADALFLELPGGGDPVDVFLVGEVPDARTAPSSTNTLEVGFQMLGFSYPVPVALDDPDLGLTPNYGDLIYAWSNGWTVVQYEQGSVFNGFVDQWSDSSFQFEPGVGYFYKAVAPIEWVSDKNAFYTWP